MLWLRFIRSVIGEYDRQEDEAVHESYDHDTHVHPEVVDGEELGARQAQDGDPDQVRDVDPGQEGRTPLTQDQPDTFHSEGRED